jgi:hypothetical protein
MEDHSRIGAEVMDFVGKDDPHKYNLIRHRLHNSKPSSRNRRGARRPEVQPKQPLKPNKLQEQKVTSDLSVPKDVIDPRYRAMTCYNCGEPWHFVGICDKPKMCFICAIPGHYMSDCPAWKAEQPVIAYRCSAGQG